MLTKNNTYFLSRMYRAICVDKNSKPSFWLWKSFRDWFLKERFSDLTKSFLIILDILKTLELVFYHYVDKNNTLFFIQGVPKHMCWQKLNNFVLIQKWVFMMNFEGTVLPSSLMHCTNSYAKQNPEQLKHPKIVEAHICMRMCYLSKKSPSMS